MLRGSVIVLLFVSSISCAVWAQSSFVVEKTVFSTDRYDEFSPAYYGKGLVFCTNRGYNPFLSYVNAQGKGIISIYYIDNPEGGKAKNARLFSRDITTNSNDGPVSFSAGGDTIYYSRNLQAGARMADYTDARNTLGVFEAVLEGGNWTRIRELRFNNEWYNVTTPFLSHDGRRLYFASDKPGGYGGMDLYYCQWKNDYWDNPVNLGPLINTEGNEAYPFETVMGDLFFSSDGHPGPGGKDIYFSKSDGTAWLKPVGLEAPVNSEYDDFGIITDSLMSTGYFSSNRGRTVDIYSFSTDIPPLFHIDRQKENNYCFRFSNEPDLVIDSLLVEYEWDFGDGQRSKGLSAVHCYDGQGFYRASLILIDKATGRLFYTILEYGLSLKDYEQAYINSPSYIIVGEQAEFDALSCNLPGYSILEYEWIFGDGTTGKGDRIHHAYGTAGEYTVVLRLKVRSDDSGDIRYRGISRPIIVFADGREKNARVTDDKLLPEPIPADMPGLDNIVKLYPGAGVNDALKPVYGVEILNSEDKREVTGNYFRSVPWNYSVAEIFNPADSTYSYVTDRHPVLMDLYPSYRDMIALGYEHAEVKEFYPEDPAEQELYRYIGSYGTRLEAYFDNAGRLLPNGYLMLDQLVRLMNKYPDIRLEIAVDGPNAKYSATRTQTIIAYFGNKDISTDRYSVKRFTGQPAGSQVSSGGVSNRMVRFRIIR